MAAQTKPAFRPYIPAASRLRELSVRSIFVGTVLGMIFGMSSLYLTLKVGLTVSASIPVAVISITLFRFWAKFGEGIGRWAMISVSLLLLAVVSPLASVLCLNVGAKLGTSVVIGAVAGVLVCGAFYLFSKFTKMMGTKDATILEHNLAQTAGSAGESIAFGVGVTMPAILILGFDLEIWRVLLVAVLGGLLGILMMIPLRRALIVLQHGELKYPEGTACAEVLKAGANAESRAAADPIYQDEKSVAGISARTIFAGFGLGLLYKSVQVAGKLWKEVPEKIFGAPLKSGSISCEISPEMLGVGYIIGPRIGGVMAAGGVLSYLLLIPLIKFFGESLSEPLAPATTVLIRDMEPGQIRSAYILYIGAGAVAAGGLISLARAVPTIWHGLKAGLSDLTGIGHDQPAPPTGTAEKIRQLTSAVTPRTERDLSMKFVLIGVVLLITGITLAPPLHMNLLGAALIVLLGFLFVTVSSRLTGEIGSSSNPISGMTIATLLLTCLAFLAVGWTGNAYYVTALSVGAIVCIACSNGGTTSQDLKTGFLVGGTPKYQQIAILVGAFASALVLGPTLLKLNQNGTVYVDAAQVAPSLRVPVAELAGLKKEHITGPQAGDDSQDYFVWHQPDPQGGAAKKFLVDAAGKPVWMVDPGINGTVKELPDGSKVTKYDAPKATLVSYIIKGILDRKLPWGLVLFGVMISLTLELCGIGSLAFAVGVYLPISTSVPIFVGGLVRWLVDRHSRGKHVDAGLTEEQIAAESDKSPGVLMASGYIAGGAIAGIVIAFMAAALSKLDHSLTDWAEKSNPFFAGSYSDLLSLLPFAVLCGLLYLAAREKILAGKPG